MNFKQMVRYYLDEENLNDIGDNQSASALDKLRQLLPLVKDGSEQQYKSRILASLGILKTDSDPRNAAIVRVAKTKMDLLNNYRGTKSSAQAIGSENRGIGGSFGK